MKYNFDDTLKGISKTKFIKQKCEIGYWYTLESPLLITVGIFINDKVVIFESNMDLYDFKDFAKKHNLDIPELTEMINKGVIKDKQDKVYKAKMRNNHIHK